MAASIVTSFLGPILSELAKQSWNSIAGCASAVRGLEHNLKSLETEWRKLKLMKEDLEMKIKHEEERQMEPTVKVQRWLLDVEMAVNLSQKALKEGEEQIRKKCMGNFCPRNCFSSHKVAEQVSQSLKTVSKLISEGDFDVVAQRKPRNPVEETPLGLTVGLDSTVETVWGYLRDNSVGNIGIHGTGGVGKTTLLKKIKNEFLRRNHDFGVVIWAEVSREDDQDKVHEKVQEVIRNKLEICPDDSWKNKSWDEKAEEIFSFLKNKKFVLLLDNLWERLDLLKIGIPLPHDRNGSKVILTTRSEDVCGKMGAQKFISVTPLQQNEALELFRSSVGEYALNSHPDIPGLAEMFAQKCKGLPLALVTVGRAMASKTNPQEWKHGMKFLQNVSSYSLLDMTKVLELLRFSYDQLDNLILKSCFLYCSVFPENYDIRKNELIELWYGEGLLDEFDDIHRVRDEGECIITFLQRVNLLESSELEGRMRMHDMIREMAIWVARDCGKKMNNHLVLDRLDSLQLTPVNWKEAKRITLWGYNTHDLPETPTCPNLYTLFVRDTVLMTFPKGFFTSMNVLRVLDLSGNQDLTELPTEIGSLVTLQYLNLSLTSIRILPVELQNLKNLKCLLLDYTSNLVEIPIEVISGLSSLEMYSKMHGVIEYFNPREASYANEVSLLRAFEALPRLREISITIFTASSMDALQLLRKLQGSIRRLMLMKWPEPVTQFVLPCFDSKYSNRMRYLERLEIYGCNLMRHITASHPLDRLHQVHIQVCSQLMDLRWIHFAPSLEILSVLDCDSMEEIIEDGYRWEPFLKLTTISLIRLPRLRSISRQALHFTSLVEMEVRECPNLRQLPFDSGSARSSLKQIKGERKWWERLGWHDEATREYADSKFVSTIMKKHFSAGIGPSFSSTEKVAITSP